MDGPELSEKPEKPEKPKRSKKKKAEQTDETLGVCRYCGMLIPTQDIGRHLISCEERKACIISETGGEPCTFFVMKATGRKDKDKKYWIYFEVQADMTLDTVDQFLRDIWLECCNHWSQFYISGKSYEKVPATHRNDMQSVSLKDVLKPRMKCSYTYDNGDSTELEVAITSSRKGRRQKEPVKLIARNCPPVFLCEHCKTAPATMAVAKYLGFHETFLCEDCVTAQGLDKYDTLPISNSPRVGVCGYAGSKIYPEVLVPDKVVENQDALFAPKQASTEAC